MSIYFKSVCLKNFGHYRTKGKLPPTVTSYPHIFQKTKHIKNYPDFSDLNKQFPTTVKFRNIYKRVATKEVAGPREDYINFKRMSGNEILYNLINLRYFRKLEILNAFNQLSLRVCLPENESHNPKIYNWQKNDLTQKLFARVVELIPRISVSRFFNI